MLELTYGIPRSEYIQEASEEEFASKKRAQHEAGGKGHLQALMRGGVKLCACLISVRSVGSLEKAAPGNPSDSPTFARERERKKNSNRATQACGLRSTASNEPHLQETTGIG